MIKHFIILLLILIMASGLRLIQTNQIPPGVYLDEASMAYDAYSMGLRSQDQYGESWPVYFRSYANYQAPLYIYLSIIPVKIFGMSPFAIRFISIISGILIIIETYLLLRLLIHRNKNPALWGGFVLAISPWAVLFSRSALEANLGLTLFIGSLLAFFWGIAKMRSKYLILALILLALTNYAYHAYRFISLVTLILIIVIYFKQISASLKKAFIAGVIIFIIILIPQLSLTGSAGSFERYNSLDYTSLNYFQVNGGQLKTVTGGRIIYIIQEFAGKYIDYLSPKSLFLDTDPTAVRSIPELAVFYSWMLIPFLWGLVFLARQKITRSKLFFGGLALAAIIPGAITRDNLYTLRVLTFYWIVVFIIALGLDRISQIIPKISLKLTMVGVILLLGLSQLYINYFILLKNERRFDHSAYLNELFMYTKAHPQDKFIAELNEPLSYGIALYIYKFDPNQFQKMAKLDLFEYYSDTNLKKDYQIANVEFRDINWEHDPYTDKYLIGDELTIPFSESALQFTNNHLILKKIFGYNLDPHYIAIYQTNPKGKCFDLRNKSAETIKIQPLCQKYLEEQ